MAEHPGAGGNEATNTTSHFLAADNLLLDGPVAREWNLFQLQVDELLSEIKYDNENQYVEAIIEKLRAMLAKIPEQEVEPSVASSFLDALPLSSLRKIAMFALEDKLPQNFPAKKDHLNHQYHAKRAMYLAVIAQYLQRAKGTIFKHTDWEFSKNDLRKPVLVLIPKSKKIDCPPGFKIVITTAIEESTFPLEKLGPDRNNLRSVVGKGKNANGEPNLLPSPCYNNSILEDVFTDGCCQALRKASSKLPQIMNTSLLLKIWARQQGLDVIHNDFCGDLLPAYAAYLAETRKLAPAMTSVQMLRAIFKSLSDPKCFKSPIFLERAESGLTAPPAYAAFKEASDCVFVDSSGWRNLADHIGKSAIQQLQRLAGHSAVLLEKLKSAEEVFQALFLRKRAPLSSFDYFYRVTLPDHDESLLTSDSPRYRCDERRVENLVRKALGNRIKMTRIFSQRLPSQANLSEPMELQRQFYLALEVDVEHAFTAIEIGPEADSPQAAAFRQFWGQKAEMRKFLDGRICEAVAWNVSASSRHTIFDLILEYIIPKHLGANVQCHSNCLDWVLTQRNCSRDEQLNSRRLADAALLKLGKQLRSLTTLPLKVVSVQPISINSRHTSPFGPLPHPFSGGPTNRGMPVARCLEPVEALLQVEGSGKWPDNVEAFKKMKAAIGIQIGEELFTNVGLRADASEECLDVFADGFAFRLYIFSERDSAVALKDANFASEHTIRQNLLKHNGLVSQISGLHPTFRASTELAIRWVTSQLMSHQVPLEAVELICAALYMSKAYKPPGSPLAGFMGFLRILSRHPWSERPLVVDPEGTMDAALLQACDSSFQKAKEDGFAPGLPIVSPQDPASSHWTPVCPSPQTVNRLVALASRSLRIVESHCWGADPQESPTGLMLAWDPALPDFDALIVLRREAIPSSDLALRTPTGHARLTEGLLPLAGFPEEESSIIEPAKSSKVALRNIPARVIKAWGSSKMMQELVVGFDPVGKFVDLLKHRFGHLGMFFSDQYGGDIIAIKWHSQAFVAQPIQPETAHTSLPLHIDNAFQEARPKKRAKWKHKVVQDCTVVPDLLRVMSEIKEVGAGLVADVRLKRTS